jgi:perosamine synthetase
MSAPDPIPLAKPELGAREEELVLEVLRSGRLSLGPAQERFEREFADWLGVADAVAVSSGTAALHLGVRRLGWGPGDEVVTSPFSFVASANCLLYEGATPVFADIDPVTLNLDPAAAQAAVGERTAGLLPVHIFGYPAATELRGVADGAGLGLLEDACEAAGAIDADGIAVGARGDLATFAFYANKQLTTGEGGIIVPRSVEEAAILRSERNQGRMMGGGGRRPKPTSGVVEPAHLDMGWLDHDRVGFNYRLTELQAALGIAQVERAYDLLAERARVAALYAGALGAMGGKPAGEGPAEGLVLPCADRGQEVRSWFVYTLRLPAEADREAVIADLDQRGIASKAYLPCIHLMPHYRERFGFKGGEFRVAEEVAERSLALPFFPAMTEHQVELVVEALGEGLGSKDWA